MAKKKTIRTIPQERTPMREQPADERRQNFGEVACGYAWKRRSARPSAA